MSQKCQAQGDEVQLMDEYKPQTPHKEEPKDQIESKIVALE